MKAWEKALMFGMLWSIQGDTASTTSAKVMSALMCLFYVGAALVLMFKPNTGDHRPPTAGEVVR